LAKSLPFGLFVFVCILVIIIVVLCKALGSVRISSGHYSDVATAIAKHTLLTFIAVSATLTAL